ncbi:oligosaccharide flippase family protein [Lapillicoccus jejuensis]|uniref:PST family polysaccharide transporter n=1 Tax=Lapillicoccus jejuensis TaxID=402171 RepID=A0A542E1R9_9MICO|nr:oligosaccharide flippase family protein [Lapillicoccus jejuensis]TQJ09164.1 PST family polysaccharide transporter [Lapillicoccus jejuensis]
MTQVEPVPATAVAAADPAEGAPHLGRAMGTGLAWSLLNNVVGRLGSFLAGIVVVRHLAQAEYGTYATGLVVLTILLSMNELGVSVAVIQHRGRVEDIAPTVMTISVVSSTVLAAIAFGLTPTLAGLMGAPEATGLIQLLLVGVVLDGIAAVPNALLTRLFQQRRRLVIDTVAFVVGTPITVVMAMTGHGAWSLGWGAVVGNLTTAVLALVWSPVRVRPGWRPDVVRGLLGFGLPLAGASLLALLILNVDFIVVGHVLGPVQLGLYLLAFNLCSWPITVVTSAIRRVAIALFARLAEHAPDGGRADVGRVLGLVLAVTVPLCAALGGYADVLIRLLYGEPWVAAAAALTPLAVLSLARVGVEVTYDFLAGSGRTASTVWLHGVWLVALVPALTVGAHVGGIRGVGIGHAVVAVLVVGATLAVVLHRAGVPVRATGRQLRPAVVGGLLLCALAVTTRQLLGDTLAALGVGVLVGAPLYLACLWPLRRAARELWELRAAPVDGAGPAPA